MLKKLIEKILIPIFGGGEENEYYILKIGANQHLETDFYSEARESEYYYLSNEKSIKNEL